MGQLSDGIMNAIASLIGRFVVGAFAAVASLAFAAYVAPQMVVDGWPISLIAAGIVGLFYALFGLRKGPGLI